MVDRIRSCSPPSRAFHSFAYRDSEAQDSAECESPVWDLRTLALDLASSHQDDCELKPGGPIERELAGGEAHLYRVTLTAGQYMHVVVDQRGIDVVVTLFGPDGQPIIEMDSPNDTQGPEEVSVIAEASGDYRVEVRALEKWVVAGRYEMRIEELREPRPPDRIRIAAEKTFAEGQKLRERGTAESLRRAIEKYKEALPLWRAVGDQRGEANALHNIGLVYNWLGKPQEALNYSRQALWLRQSMGDHHGEASAFTNFGLAYWLLGEPQKALNYLSQALPLLRAVRERIVEATMLANIGSVFTSLGEHQEALNYFDEALRLSRAMGGCYEEAEALTGMGRVYNALADRQKALDYLRQALWLRRTVADRRGEANTLYHIGAVYDSLGEEQKALNYLGQALRLRQAVGNRQGEARTLHHIGRVYASLDEKRKAFEYCEQALSLWWAVGDRFGEAETLYGIACIERDLDNLAEARTQVEAALDIIESLRTKLVSQDLRNSFFASNRNCYEFYIDLLMQLHQRHPADGFDAAALQASERARARSLLETLTEAHAGIRQGVDPVLLERERALQQQLNARAHRQTWRLTAKHSEARAAAEKTELEALLTQYRDVQAQIRARSPRYAALTQPQPLSVREVQQQVLDEETLLLEYALGEERSYLWAVAPTSITSFELPRRAEIETAARRVYDLMTARNKRVKFETIEERRARVAQADAEYPAAAAALSRMLLEPVTAQLSARRLLIVSEGALQYIPFGALPAPKGSVVRGQSPVAKSKTTDNGQRTTDKAPLVIDHEIVSLPSASALAVLRREVAGRTVAAKAVAVLADPVFDSHDPRVKNQLSPPLSHSPILPLSSDLERSVREVGLADDQPSIPRLPFTRQEAEGITVHVLPDDGLKAVDFAASRATVTNAELNQYRIVHFATHGLLNSQHPELSGVVLSLVNEQGQPQDGFLRAHEIYNLNLSADLVVLSGCKTGLGKEVKGEGLVGLTRGFMYAGAARVVVSLWDVHDAATAELMKRFYHGMLTNGRRPAAALQTAQVSLRQETGWEAPYYWAGFVLQGEWT